MKTISIAISEKDYDAFQRSARRQGRPVAQLIREAMAFYRKEALERREPLADLPLLPGHRPLGPVPRRSELYEEVFGEGAE